MFHKLFFEEMCLQLHRFRGQLVYDLVLTPVYLIAYLDSLNCLYTFSMLHEYWVLVSHTIPAYVADMGFVLLGKRPRLVPHSLLYVIYVN